MANRTRKDVWVGDIDLIVRLSKRGGPHEAPYQWDWHITEQLEDGALRVRHFGAIPVYGNFNDDEMNPDLAEALKMIQESEAF